VRLDGALDPVQAFVERAPLAREQVDQERQVVDPGMTLREQIGLDPFEPTDGLVREPLHLCQPAGDRGRLLAEALAKRVADGVGQRDLELVGGDGERLDLEARPVEGGSDLGRERVAIVHDPTVPRPPDRISRMRTEELDYDLPPELIAQQPAARRDESRLLVYARASGEVRHRIFRELPEELPEGMLVVVNDTRVVPARIRIERPRGEMLLLERLGEAEWEALARPSRRLRAGRRYGPVELLEELGEGRWRLRLAGEPAGETPLPPYIVEPLREPERYQTVYARAAGSAAAPTAGLHFTPELLLRLDVERVTLHVGLDTFRPVSELELETHRLHGERYEVRPEAWERIRGAASVLAVGTTTVRVLETLARAAPLAGRTDLFVTPGFSFQRVDALLTNFHLPRSTLLALVMAFAGVEQTRRLYELAIEERYRFYSFGDAMLIL
jgi:S-adenosylmethionine:tRNA ribosyltransferase-isomerase